jgi:hypothetical protein
VEQLRERGTRSVFFPKIIAGEAKVSWSVAARAITAVYPMLGYLRFVRDSNDRLFVRTSSVSAGAGSFVGERAYIRDSDLLRVSRELRPGARKTITASFAAGALKVKNAPCAVFRECAHEIPTFVVAISLQNSFNNCPGKSCRADRPTAAENNNVAAA